MLPWLRLICRRIASGSRPTHQSTKRATRPRPEVEALETREVPARLPLVNCDFANFTPMVLGDANARRLADRICRGLPQVSFDLTAATDTGDKGDSRTDLARVNVEGRATPRSKIRILGTDIKTVADRQGNFTLRNIPLTPGINDLTVRSSVRGGTFGQSTKNIVRNSAPTVANTIGNVTKPDDVTETVIDLSQVFADVDINDTIVRFRTNQGNIDVALFDEATPQTISNFMRYVNRGAYSNTFFHRSVQNFIIQAGGFTFNETNNTVPEIPADAPVQNEPGISNQRGTLAVAKLPGDPNSGTSQFFFNLNDNSSNLDEQNGGFTVFGRVINETLKIVDTIAGIETQNRGGPFTEIPLIDLPRERGFPEDTDPENLALIRDVAVRLLRDRLTLTVVSGNPALVTATVENNNSLRLVYQPGMTGTTTVTVRATDMNGAFVETTFTVTV